MDILVTLIQALVGIVVILGGPVLYLWMQVMALMRWRGAWLVLALVPLAAMGAITVYTVDAYLAQSNLWPLMFILSAPLAILWLGIAALIRARVAM